MTVRATEQAFAKSITGISSMATRYVLAELAAAYEAQSAQRVAIESVGGVDALRRVESGEAFDFVVLASGAMGKLAAAGHFDAVIRVDIARSPVAIAVAAGNPCPDVATEHVVRNAVLAARTIGYSTGPSGVHLESLFAQWGIAGVIAQRIVKAPPGVSVASLITAGKVELGFQQLSELIHEPGIQVVGPLPPEIQLVTIFSGAACKASMLRAAASDFLSFCASPEAAEAKRRHGMAP